MQGTHAQARVDVLARRICRCFNENDLDLVTTQTSQENCLFQTRRERCKQWPDTAADIVIRLPKQRDAYQPLANHKPTVIIGTIQQPLLLQGLHQSVTGRLGQARRLDEVRSGNRAPGGRDEFHQID